MARTKKSGLNSKESRLSTPPQKKRTETLGEGRYIYYRRPANGASGIWTARWWHKATKTEAYEKLGMADDFLDANGEDVLDWTQATVKAMVWFGKQEAKIRGELEPEKTKQAPYLVSDAIKAYRQEAEREGRAMVTLDSILDTHVLPSLGDKVVERLTVEELKDWHAALAAAPRRKTGRKTSEPGEWKEKPTEEQLRARKNTANRILATLKRALTLAVINEKVSGERQPWLAVKPFKKVGGIRTRFLSKDEVQRLVNGATEEFRPLIKAAIYTGSRLGPLTRAKVGDFHPEAGTIFIQKDKDGKARHVILDDDATAWFKTHTAGRDKGELMFTRHGVKRSTRKGTEDQWMPDDQKHQMKLACTNGKVAKLTFHELRHTYASELIKQGVQLSYVAAQLGHADTRMVEKYYGHLCPSDMAKVLREKAPDWGMEDEQANVEAIQVKQA